MYQNLGGKFTVLVLTLIILLSPQTSHAINIGLPFEKGSKWKVTRGYDTPPTHVGKDKYAIDFSIPGEADYGKNILAVYDGIVEISKWENPNNSKQGYGQYVLIDHENGLLSRYTHLKERFVSVGDKIKKGQIIGEANNTGYSSGTHLHFVMYQKDENGKLLPYKPEPISNYTNLTAGNWYTSDNELYHPNKTQETEAPEITQTKHSLWSRLKSYLNRLFRRQPPTTQAEEEQQITTTEQNNNETLEQAENANATFTPSTQTATGRVNSSLTYTITTQNTGNTTWTKQNTSLNIVGNVVDSQPYTHQSWLTSRRPAALDQNTVPSGETGTFTLTITTPPSTGEFIFRTQIVKQTENTFTQVGEQFHTLEITTTEEQPAPQPTTAAPTPPPSIIENIETFIDNVIDTTEETVDNIIETITDIVADPLQGFEFIGGGGGENNENQEDTEEPEENETSVQAPEISITFPTSTLHTTSSTITILGTHTDAANILVNNQTTSTLTINTSTWIFSPALEIATNTYSFVGRNGNNSSATHTVHIVREAITLSSTTITSPTSTVTTSPAIVLSGKKDSRATTLIIEHNSTTTTQTNTTSSWSQSLTLQEGTNTITAHSEDTDANTSPSSTITVTLDTTPPIIETFTQTTSTNRLNLSYTASDETTQVATHTIDLYFPEQDEDPAIACPNNTSTFRSINDPILENIDTLIDELIATPCTYFQLTTTSQQVALSFNEDVATLPVIARVAATDIMSNQSPYTYSEQIIISNNLGEIINPNPDNTIVITEIAWMGTLASANDEWIELYNPTFADITLTDWQLIWEGVSIDLSAITILAGDYAVLERTDQTTITNYETPNGIYTGGLKNTGEHLQLIDNNDTLIDEVNATTGWFAGDNDTKQSMTKITPNLSGNDPASWCTYSTCPPTSQVGNPLEIRHDAEDNEIFGSPGGPIHEPILVR